MLRGDGKRFAVRCRARFAVRCRHGARFAVWRVGEVCCGKRGEVCCEMQVCGRIANVVCDFVVMDAEL